MPPTLSDYDTWDRLSDPHLGNNWSLTSLDNGQYKVEFRDGQESRPFTPPEWSAAMPEVMTNSDLRTSFPGADQDQFARLHDQREKLRHQIATGEFAAHGLPATTAPERSLRGSYARDLVRAQLDYEATRKRAEQPSQASVATMQAKGFGQSPRAGAYSTPAQGTGANQAPQAKPRAK